MTSWRAALIRVFITAHDQHYICSVKQVFLTSLTHEIVPVIRVIKLVTIPLWEAGLCIQSEGLYQASVSEKVLRKFFLFSNHVYIVRNALCAARLQYMPWIPICMLVHPEIPCEIRMCASHVTATRNNKDKYKYSKCLCTFFVGHLAAAPGSDILVMTELTK